MNPDSLADWFKLLVGGGGTLAIFTAALVGVLKAPLDFIPDKYWPVLSLAVGIGWSVLASLALGGTQAWTTTLAVGVVAGMLASGAVLFGKIGDGLR